MVSLIVSNLEVCSRIVQIRIKVLLKVRGLELFQFQVVDPEWVDWGHLYRYDSTNYPRFETVIPYFELTIYTTSKYIHPLVICR